MGESVVAGIKMKKPRHRAGLFICSGELCSPTSATTRRRYSLEAGEGAKL